MLKMCERRRRECQARQDEGDVRSSEGDPALSAPAEERSPGRRAEADEHVDEELDRQEEARLDRARNGR